MKPMFSRRSVLWIFAGAGCSATAPSLRAATPFWDRKRPTEWSSDEIAQLTSRSPWARETNVDFEAAEGGRFEVPGSGAPYGGADGGGRGATIEKPAGVMKKAPVLVRWESAQPIRDALLTPLAKAFDGHYVLSVSNIPVTAMNPEKRGGAEPPPVTLDSFLAELQEAATLSAGGKQPEGPGVVQRMKGTESTFLFGFSKELLPITPGDREADFTLRTARVSVKARFSLKDMMYRGGLAV